MYPRFFRMLTTLSAIVLGFAAALGTAGPCFAATFTVTNLANGGLGSLRQAIGDSSANPGPDRIVFDASLEGTIELSVRLARIFDPVEIIGPGADKVTVDANQHGRVLVFSGTESSNFLVEGLTLEGGFTASGGGGGIALFGGILMLDDVHLINNAVTESACGGGFFGSPGTLLTMLRSVVADNWAGCGGGMFAADLIVEQSAIYRNVAATAGGGIWSDDRVTLKETTVSGNTASQERSLTSSGGGLHLRGSTAILDLFQTTIVGNSADLGPGIFLEESASVLTVANTVIAGNRLNSSSAEENCSEDFGLAGSHNLSGDSSCGFDGPGDIEDTDPKLFSLGWAGGPTPSHVPAPNSPLLDQGLASFCKDFDQRGFERPIDADGVNGAECDIGAVEYRPGSDDPIHVDGFESGDLQGWSGSAG